MHKCPEPGCDYAAKTPGAITQHVNRSHSQDPLAAVRNSIGVGAPRPGGAFRTDRPLTAAPSGVPSVDYAIGIGGVPRGTIIEVFGPPASGKTFMALTFSAYAQSVGQRAGYMDAERALQPTFAKLVPGLSLDALEYGQPPGKWGDEMPFDGTGEAALEASRRFIDTGEFAVWTVDSVAACTPRDEMKRSIGDPASMAGIAKLMRSGLRVLTPAVERTNCVLVFVNHVTAKPGVMYGRDWSKPADEAFNYFSSVQLKVDVATQYFNKAGRRIGHRVKVKVHKSKVAAPHASAEYDLFYAEDVVVPKKNQDIDAGPVVPGIDIASSYFGVLKEEGRIAPVGGRYVDTVIGEMLGTRAEVREQLTNPTSPLFQAAHSIVYPTQYVKEAA